MTSISAIALVVVPCRLLILIQNRVGTTMVGCSTQVRHALRTFGSSIITESDVHPRTSSVMSTVRLYKTSVYTANPLPSAGNWVRMTTVVTPRRI